MTMLDVPLPVLYSFRRCPYAMRARLAVAIAKIPVELREVKLSAKPNELLVVSPKATVPVLVLADGTIIDQSLDIMQFALSQHDPEKWLRHIDEDLITNNDGEFKHHLDCYKYPERHSSDALIHRTAGMGFLVKLDTQLQQWAFLCGSSRSLTDMAIAPFVRQFAAVDREWFACQPLPGLQKWLADFERSDLFETIMLREKPWSADQPRLIVDWK